MAAWVESGAASGVTRWNPEELLLAVVVLIVHTDHFTYQEILESLLFCQPLGGLQGSVTGAKPPGPAKVTAPHKGLWGIHTIVRN